MGFNLRDYANNKEKENQKQNTETPSASTGGFSLRDYANKQQQTTPAAPTYTGRIYPASEIIPQPKVNYEPNQYTTVGAYTDTASSNYSREDILRMLADAKVAQEQERAQAQTNANRMSAIKPSAGGVEAYTDTASGRTSRDDILRQQRVNEIVADKAARDSAEVRRYAQMGLDAVKQEWTEKEQDYKNANALLISNVPFYDDERYNEMAPGERADYQKWRNYFAEKLDLPLDDKEEYEKGLKKFLDDYGPNGVAYTDSDGNKVTYANLYYTLENEQNLKKIANDPTLKQTYETNEVLKKQRKEIERIIERADGSWDNLSREDKEAVERIAKRYGVDRVTTANTAAHVMNLITKRIDENAAILNEAGYDYERVSEYERRQREAEEIRKNAAKTKKFAEDHPVLATLLTIIDFPVNLIGGAATLLTGKGSATPEDAGNYVPFNTNTNAVNRFNQTVTSAVAEKFAAGIKDFTGSDFLAWVAKTGYTGVSSFAHSAAVTLTLNSLFGPAGAKLGLALLGTEAGMNGVEEAARRGVSNGKAVMYGLASGINEALFEEISLDRFLKMDVSRASLAKGFKEALLQGGVEASEEFFTTLANTAADRIINTNLSEYNANVAKYVKSGMSEAEAKRKAALDFCEGLAEDAFGGFVGGSMGAGGKILGTFINERADTAKQIRNAVRGIDADKSVVRKIANGKELTTDEAKLVIADPTTSAAVQELTGMNFAGMTLKNGQYADTYTPEQVRSTLTRWYESGATPVEQTESSNYPRISLAQTTPERIATDLPSAQMQAEGVLPSNGINANNGEITALKPMVDKRAEWDNMALEFGEQGREVFDGAFDDTLEGAELVAIADDFRRFYNAGRDGAVMTNDFLLSAEETRIPVVQLLGNIEAADLEAAAYEAGRQDALTNAEVNDIITSDNIEGGNTYGGQESGVRVPRGSLGTDVQSSRGQGRTVQGEYAQNQSGREGNVGRGASEESGRDVRAVQKGTVGAKVSPKQLGIRSGSDASNVVMKAGDYAIREAAKLGVDVTAVKGALRMKDGVVDGISYRDSRTGRRGIVYQGDSKLWTEKQFVRHEGMHVRIAQGKVSMNAISDAIKRLNKTDADVRTLFDAYLAQYGDIYDDSVLLEEIFCDAYAAMDRFGVEGARKAMDTIRREFGKAYEASQSAESESVTESYERYSINANTYEYAKNVTGVSKQTEVAYNAIRELGAIQKEIGRNIRQDLPQGHWRMNIHNMNEYLAKHTDVWQRLVDIQKTANENGVPVDFVTPVGKPYVIEGKTVEGGLKGFPIEYVTKEDGGYKFNGFARSLSQLFVDRMNDAARWQMQDEFIAAVEDAYKKRESMTDPVPELEKMLKTIAKEFNVPGKNIASKTKFSVQTALRSAKKTVMALNLNAACPMFTVGNHGCYLDACYLTQMGAGGNTVNLFQSSIYAGEILQLSQATIDMLNADPDGLRINGVGDTIRGNKGALLKVFEHAAMRGLKLKIITKQIATLEILREAAKQGIDISDITVQLSMDNLWIPAMLDDAWGSGIRGTVGIAQTVKKGNLEAASAAYDAIYGREAKTKDGVLYRKYGFSAEKVNELIKGYPEINILPRYVVTTASEIADLALGNGPLGQGPFIQTLMHGVVPEPCYSDYPGKVLNFGSLRHVVEKNANGEWEFYGARVAKDKQTGAVTVTRVNSTAHAEVDAYIKNNYTPAEQDVIYRNLQKQLCCKASEKLDACAGCQALYGGGCSLCAALKAKRNQNFAIPADLMDVNTTPADTAKYSRTDADIRFSEDADFEEFAPVWYSNMSRVIDGIKTDKVGANGVIPYLKGRGVKDEEIKWSGLATFLEGKKSVTKAELQQFAQDSMLKIEEETLRNDAQRDALLEEFARRSADLLARARRTDAEGEYEDRYNDLSTWTFSDIRAETRQTLDAASVERQEYNEALDEASEAAHSALPDMFRVNFKGIMRRITSRVLENADATTSEQLRSATDKIIDELELYNGFISPNTALAMQRVRDAYIDELYEAVEARYAYKNRKLLPEQQAFFDEIKKYEDNEDGGMPTPRWGDYALPDGENYRELLFKMPGSTYSNAAMDAHWTDDRPGVFAHARMQDMHTDAGKMLFIEEIQSDWHNAGAKKGYLDVGRESEYKEAREKAADRVHSIGAEMNRIDNELKAKELDGLNILLGKEGRVLLDAYAATRSAADERRGVVSSKERYANAEYFAKVIRSVAENRYLAQRYGKEEIQNQELEIPKWVSDAGAESAYKEYVSHMVEMERLRDAYRELEEEREKVITRFNEYTSLVPDAPFRNNYTDFVMKRLLRLAAEEGYDSIGWTTAEQQKERWSKAYEEGYRIEYDQDIPKFMRKYGKQWGGEVTQTKLDNGETVWQFVIPNAMKESALFEGQPMFSRAEEGINTDLAGDAAQMLSDLRRQLREANAKLANAKGQLKRTEQPTVRSDDARRISRDIIKRYGSKASVDGISKAVEDLGNLIVRGSDENGDATYTRIKEAASDIMYNIISMSDDVYDADAIEVQKQIRSKLQSTKFYVSEYEAGDLALGYEDYNDFRRRNFGSVKTTSDPKAMRVDAFYEEVCGQFPWMFDTGLTNQADQLKELIRVSEMQLKPTYNIAEESEVEAYDLLERVMSTELRQVQTFADKAARRQELAVAHELNKESALKERIAALKDEIEREKQKRRDELKVKRAVIEEERKRFRDYKRTQAEKRREREASDRLLKMIKRVNKMELNAPNRAWFEQHFGDIYTLAKTLTGNKIASMDNLEKRYGYLKEHDQDFIGSDRIENQFAEFRNKQRDITSMTEDEIAAYTTTLLMFEKQVREGDKMTRIADRTNVRMMAYNVISDVNATKGVKSSGLVSKIEDALITNTLDAIRSVRRYTGYNDGDPLYQRTLDLARGQQDVDIYVTKAREKFANLLADKKFTKWFTGPNAAEINVTVKDARTGEESNLTITPALRTALYLNNQNDDNRRHITYGGIVFPDVKLLKKGEFANAYAKGKTIRLTPTEISKITRDMTSDEKNFARVTNSYFSEMSAPEIERVHEELFGVPPKMVGAGYYPLKVVKGYLRNSADETFDINADTTSGAFDIGSPGWLKERVTSEAPIYLFPVDRTVNTSIEQHGKYVGLAIPYNNFNKLWNAALYKKTDRYDPLTQQTKSKYIPNIEVGTVRENIEAKWGQKAGDTIQQFLDQITGKEKTGASGIFGRLRSNYAGAVLELNPSTALKQAPSGIAAAAVVGWGPLAKALNPALKVDTSFVDKMTAAFLIRRAGYSSQELGELADRGKKLPPALSWIIGADLATTSMLKRAAAFYVRDNTDLAVGSDEYKRAVVDVYQQIISETQPTYDVLYRSKVLRSKNQLVRALNMFRTQPYKNFNILYDSLGNLQAKRKAYHEANRWASDDEQSRRYAEEAKAAYHDAKKRVVWAFSSQAVAGLMISLIMSGWDMLRGRDKKYRDEDGEVTFWSFLKGLGINFASTGAGMIPGGSVLLESVESLVDMFAKDDVFGTTAYGFSVPEVDLLNDTISGVGKLAKTLYNEVTAEDGANWENIGREIYSSIEQFAQFAGIPLENARKTVEVMARQVFMTEGEYVGEYMASRFINGNPLDHKSESYALLYRAKRNDAEQYNTLYEQMVKDGFKEDDIRNAMNKKIAADKGLKSTTELANKDRYLSPSQQKTYDSVTRRVKSSDVWAASSASSRAKLNELAYSVIAGEKRNEWKTETVTKEYDLTQTEYILYQLALDIVDEVASDGKHHPTNEEKAEAVEKAKQG